MMQVEQHGWTCRFQEYLIERRGQVNGWAEGANKKEHTSKEDDWMLTRVVSSHDEVPRGMRCDVEKTSKLDRLAALSTCEDVNTDVPGNNLGRAFIAEATNTTRLSAVQQLMTHCETLRLLTSRSGLGEMATTIWEVTSKHNRKIPTTNRGQIGLLNSMCLAPSSSDEITADRHSFKVSSSAQFRQFVLVRRLRASTSTLTPAARSQGHATARWFRIRPI
jgi:hypothetical protein